MAGHPQAMPAQVHGQGHPAHMGQPQMHGHGPAVHHQGPQAQMRVMPFYAGFELIPHTLPDGKRTWTGVRPQSMRKTDDQLAAIARGQDKKDSQEEYQSPYLAGEKKKLVDTVIDDYQRLEMGTNYKWKLVYIKIGRKDLVSGALKVFVNKVAVTHIEFIIRKVLKKQVKAALAQSMPIPIPIPHTQTQMQFNPQTNTFQQVPVRPDLHGHHQVQHFGQQQQHPQQHHAQQHNLQQHNAQPHGAAHAQQHNPQQHNAQNHGAHAQNHHQPHNNHQQQQQQKAQNHHDQRLPQGITPLGRSFVDEEASDSQDSQDSQDDRSYKHKNRNRRDRSGSPKIRIPDFSARRNSKTSSQFTTRSYDSDYMSPLDTPGTSISGSPRRWPDEKKRSSHHKKHRSRRESDYSRRERRGSTGSNGSFVMVPTRQSRGRYGGSSDSYRSEDSSRGGSPSSRRRRRRDLEYRADSTQALMNQFNRLKVEALEDRVRQMEDTVAYQEAPSRFDRPLLGRAYTDRPSSMSYAPRPRREHRYGSFGAF